MAFSATYVDGVTAERRPAIVSFEGGALVIEVAGEPRIRWAVEDVRDADPPESASPVLRLRRVGGEARLTLTSLDAKTTVPGLCPNLRGRERGGRALWKPIVLWGGASLAVVILLFWVALPIAARVIADSIPPEVAHRFGDRLVENVASIVGRTAGGKSRICTNSTSDHALSAIAYRVRPMYVESPMPIKVWVVRSPIVNAVALPGGHIVVFSGLLDFARSGDELAGVLAHEVGHVMLRHPTQIAIEKAAVSAFFGLFFGDITGGTAVAGVATTLLGNAYSRDMERAADDIGVKLMRENHLDPRALAAFLERMGARHGKEERMMAFFSTHPTSVERAAAIAPANGPVRPIRKRDWDSVRRVCNN